MRADGYGNTPLDRIQVNGRAHGQRAVPAAEYHFTELVSAVFEIVR